MVLTAIGVTDKIDREQLAAFATDPRYAAEIQTFMELRTTTQMVRNAILALCGRANFTLTVPPGKRLSPVGQRLELCQERKGKERKRIYIGPFIYYVYLKALRHGSHSFTCKYTMPAFPSYAFTRWRHL